MREIRFQTMGVSALMFAALSALAGLTILSFAAAQTPGDGAGSDERVPREYQGFVPDTGHLGVIDDPDGYVNVRSRKDAESPIVAKVKKGERFTFQRNEYDKWCSVKLTSGKTGWMDAQRILLFFTEDDLPPKSDKEDEDRRGSAQARDQLLRSDSGSGPRRCRSAKEIFWRRQVCRWRRR